MKRSPENFALALGICCVSYFVVFIGLASVFPAQIFRAVWEMTMIPMLILTFLVMVFSLYRWIIHDKMEWRKKSLLTLLITMGLLIVLFSQD